MLAALLVGLGLATAAAAAPAEKAAAPSIPDIHLEAAADAWRATYRLRQPARRLVFPRSTDASRTEDWKPDPGFEIVATPDGEVARRRDGAAFTAVAFEVPPVYRELPKDYAPFSPFGDGGLLFHTGRFFACAEACPHDPVWSMRLSVPRGKPVLLDGERKIGDVAWTDRGQGRNLYVGDATPVAGDDYIAVVDEALPAPIRTRLARQLPLFMHHYAAKLGELPSRPMLFASYDLSPPNRVGRQGGTLPGQVFIHFYGATWPQQMAEPDFAPSLAWHFAHEAAHLYQRQIFSAEDEDAWIHEGAAEAMAALALREEDPGAVAFVESKIASAEKDCTKIRAGRSIRDTIAAGGFDAAYSCGLGLHLSIDAALRRAAPDGDGLYGVWRDYAAQADDGGSEALFLAALSRAGGDALAERVRLAVRAAESDAKNVS